jgi:hypothetical protein
MEQFDSIGVRGQSRFREELETPTPGVFGKEFAALTKERGWVTLRIEESV